MDASGTWSAIINGNEIHYSDFSHFIRAICRDLVDLSTQVRQGTSTAWSPLQAVLEPLQDAILAEDSLWSIWNAKEKTSTRYQTTQAFWAEIQKLNQNTRFDQDVLQWPLIWRPGLGDWTTILNPLVRKAIQLQGVNIERLELRMQGAKTQFRCSPGYDKTFSYQVKDQPRTGFFSFSDMERLSKDNALPDDTPIRWHFGESADGKSRHPCAGNLAGGWPLDTFRVVKHLFTFVQVSTANKPRPNRGLAPGAAQMTTPVRRTQADPPLPQEVGLYYLASGQQYGPIIEASELIELVSSKQLTLQTRIAVVRPDRPTVGWVPAVAVPEIAEMIQAAIKEIENEPPTWWKALKGVGQFTGTVAKILLVPETRMCRSCREKIKWSATRCPYCTEYQ